MNRDKKILGKTVYKQVLFFSISMTVLISVYLVFNYKISKQNETKKIISQEIGEDYMVFSGVDEVEEQEEVLELSGWAFKMGAENEGVKICLYPINELGEAIIMSTKMEARQDVDVYFERESNLDESGFIATIDKNELNENACYEVVLVLDYKNSETVHDRVKVSTGSYLFNGELYNYNPFAFFSPKFLEPEMKSVVENGKLYVYEEKYGMWIYLYEDAFYWIVDDRFPFAQNGETHIPYQVWTSEVDKLPVENQKNGFEAKDFRFETAELLLSEENFRVVKEEMPSTYKIQYVLTGLFDDTSGQWVWKTKIVTFRSQ